MLAYLVRSFHAKEFQKRPLPKAITYPCWDHDPVNCLAIPIYDSRRSYRHWREDAQAFLYDSLEIRQFADCDDVDILFLLKLAPYLFHELLHQVRVF